MRIAQVAPLYESVPPKYYGGTERVVSYLTEELVRLGHDVTLFASGDSETAARLVPCSLQALRLDAQCYDQIAHHVYELEQVLQRAREFDIIHFHIDHIQFPIMRRLHAPHLTTMHGRLDLKDISDLYAEFDDMPLVSVSNAQRRPLPHCTWLGTVYHGLPTGLHTLQETPGNYLAFLGRFSPEKQPDQAIEIAQRFGMPLKMAAKVDKKDEIYFEEKIKPLLDDPLIEYVGEITESEKGEFLGKAYAMLFPINWPEPFGMVMIESMACGTPVIAYPAGSVPEVMRNGVSGFVVNNVTEAVEQLRQVAQLDRRKVRDYCLNRFSAPRMAQNYLQIYEKLTASRTATVVA